MGICKANKVKLTPPTKPLSEQGSRRCSGLIVDSFFFARMTEYQELEERSPSYSSIKHAVVGAVLLKYSYNI